MFSQRSVLTVCVSLFLAAAAGAQVARDEAPPAHVDFPACPATKAPEPDDPRWRWRLRAYTHLDCVTTIVDNALQQPRRSDSRERPDDESQTVTISRADLERIRTLAWWARDAAARIGQ